MERTKGIRLAALLLVLTMLATMGLALRPERARAQEAPGKEDLSGLTAEQLAQLASDIDNELKQNHQESNRQKERNYLLPGPEHLYRGYPYRLFR